MSRRLQRVLPVVASAALGWPAASPAMRLADDRVGQALIYPYYTVQTANGDSYNTYLSIVNHTGDAKAVRLRFREGRAGIEALALNIFLSPHDTWTAAIVAQSANPSSGPMLISADVSCTDPPADPRTAALPFSSAHFADGNGTGIDRAREGFVEAIEMGTLTGAAAAAVTQNSTGMPANCGAVQGTATPQIGAPSGGLSGTVTLINVQSGINFDLNAVALADLATHPFYRPASDPYPDFNAAEIDPVSLVVANGAAYRATWSRPVDAVSAVLMSAAFLGEYVLDDETASNTDVVAAFPTRQFYVTTTSAGAPFTLPSTWAPHCNAPGVGNRNETLSVVAFTRDEHAYAVPTDCGFPECPPSPPSPRAPFLCAATVVMDISNGSPHTAITTQSRVLGSLVRGYGQDGALIHSGFTHGWLRAAFTSQGPTELGLPSLPSSTRMDLATGAITTGPQTYYGLPMLGFTARTFVNGTLTCSAGACQGNYGGAFPFQYIRRISP